MVEYVLHEHYVCKMVNHDPMAVTVTELLLLKRLGIHCRKRYRLHATCTAALNIRSRQTTEQVYGASLAGVRQNHATVHKLVVT